jgi:hypothetical protein
MPIKPILTEIVNRLSDVAASLDALEAVLVQNHQLKNDDIRNAFDAHKLTAEGHLSKLRVQISFLPD